MTIPSARFEKNSSKCGVGYANVLLRGDKVKKVSLALIANGLTRLLQRHLIFFCDHRFVGNGYNCTTEGGG